MIIQFCVLGTPQTAGSKQSFVPLHKKTREPFRRPNGGIVVSTVDDNPHSRGWKKTVTKAAREAYRGELLTGDLAVTMYFYRPRPQSHFCKNGLSKIGRETPYPSTRPDVLKVARAVEDAITGAVWHDDAQIIEEHLFKRWGEARVEVVIEPASEVQSNLFQQTA